MDTIERYLRSYKVLHAPCCVMQFTAQHIEDGNSGEDTRGWTSFSRTDAKTNIAHTGKVFLEDQSLGESQWQAANRCVKLTYVEKVTSMVMRGRHQLQPDFVSAGQEF